MRFPQRWVVGLCCLAITSGAVVAQEGGDPQPPGHNMDNFFFPPELVLQNAERLEITEQQRAAIEDHFRKARETLQVRQADLAEATRRLHDKLAAQVTEDEALQQLDDVLDKERLMKRLHLRTLLRIRRQLTPQQLSQVETLKPRFVEQQRELQKEIEDKIAILQRFMKQRAEAAQPPPELRERMKEFEALMKSGKAREAQAALDQIVKDFVDEHDTDDDG